METQVHKMKAYLGEVGHKGELDTGSQHRELVQQPTLFPPSHGNKGGRHQQPFWKHL